MCFCNVENTTVPLYNKPRWIDIEGRSTNAEKYLGLSPTVFKLKDLLVSDAYQAGDCDTETSLFVYTVVYMYYALLSLRTWGVAHTHTHTHTHMHHAPQLMSCN